MGLGAVACLSACLITPMDDTGGDSESEGDEESTTEEDDDDAGNTPPSNPTTTPEPTTGTSTDTSTGTTDPTDTDPTDTSQGVCGDGVVDRGEACDDGVNDGAYDGCNADCQSPGPSCGDGEVDADNEVCDDGVNDGSYGGCAADCKALGPKCGDGNVDDGNEECDDGNQINDDECSDACTLAKCGDSIVQAGAGEVCDDGTNDGGYGGCVGDCSALGPYCGDGVVDDGNETCDDMNTDSADGCLGNCTAPANCQEILSFDAASASGVYMLNNGVSLTKWSAYCDMATDGGGWTLAAKVAPTSDWQYTATRWTNQVLVSPGSSNFDHVQAKLATWNEVAFSQIQLAMEPFTTLNDPNPPAPAYVSLDIAGDSLYALFSAPDFVPTTATRDTWMTLLPGASLEPNCNQEGVNNVAGAQKVRLGILASTEDSCDSPDSVVGIGYSGFISNCMNNPASFAGNLNCTAQPQVKKRGFAWIFVR